MQHASLVAFLTGRLSPEALADEIAGEVAAFDAALRHTKIGHTIVSDGPHFVLERDGARRLLEAVLNQRLPPRTAVYVADCIYASEHIEFADQATRDAVFFIEDDSGFHVGRAGIWTREEVLEALAPLNQASET